MLSRNSLPLPLASSAKISRISCLLSELTTSISWSKNAKDGPTAPLSAVQPVRLPRVDRGRSISIETSDALRRNPAVGVVSENCSVT
jgi:hypothetical protein